MMVGFKINPYMMICWTVLSPIFCMVMYNVAESRMFNSNREKTFATAGGGYGV